MKRKKRKVVDILLFISPAFIIYAVFMLMPLVASLPVGLFDWSGVGDKVFIGLGNFRKLFLTSPFNERLFNALFNNVKFFAITTVCQNGFAVLLAVFLSKNIFLRKFFRTVFFIPATFSIIIVAFTFSLLLNPQWGIINKLFILFGNPKLAYYPWTGSENTALICIALVNAWQYIGIPLIILLSTIESIPLEINESALVDGCNGWKQFWHITLPLLSQSIGLITIISFVGDFSGFEIVYGMAGTAAGPNYSTDILGTYFYRTAFGTYGGAGADMGLGAAIAAFMFVLIGIIALLWLKFDQSRENLY
jgi:raffinose/stachyose/melibiose transport system permease protein